VSQSSSLSSAPASPSPRPRRETEASVVVDGDNPWPGLPAYEERDREFFRGRQAETQQLVSAILANRFTLLYGRSGLGKTSLVKAGLFPELRAQHFLPVHLRIDFAADAPPPTAQIRAAFEAAATASAVEYPPWPSELGAWAYFHGNEVEFWSSRHKLVTPLLVFDQFEEVFTLGAQSENGKPYLLEVEDLAEGRAPLALKRRIDENPALASRYRLNEHRYRVLVCLREDYLPELECRRASMPSALVSRYRLLPMSGEQAQKAILETGSRFVSLDVATSIVRFVGGDAQNRRGEELAELRIDPALLSLVCRELNDRRLQRRAASIRLDDVDLDRSEILGRFYESCLEGLGTEVRRFIEERLITPSGSRDTEPVENARAAGIDDAAIKELVARRLIRVDFWSGVERIELSHDVLTDVVRQSRDTRLANERSEAALRTAEAQRANAERERELAVRDKQAADRKHRQRLLVGAAVAAVLVSWVAAVARMQHLSAQSAHASAQSAHANAENERRAKEVSEVQLQTQRALTLVQATAALDNDRASQALLGLATLASDPAAEDVRSLLLSELVHRNWPLPLLVIRSPDAFEVGNVGETGKFWVVGDEGGVVTIRDRDGVAVGAPLRMSEGVSDVLLSVNEQRVAAISRKGNVWAWDLPARTPHKPLATGQNYASAALTSTGGSIAVVGADGTGAVWSLDSGEKSFELRPGDGEGKITVAAFAAQDSLLVTGGETGDVVLYSKQGHAQTLHVFSHRIQRLAAAYDTNVVALTDGGALVLLDTTKRTTLKVQVVVPRGAGISALSFSRDRKHVAAGFSDGQVFLVDMKGARTAHVQLGTAVQSVSFAEHALVTTDRSGKARLWSFTGAPLSEVMSTANYSAADISPDATRAYSVSWDKTARVWDTEPGAAQPERLGSCAVDGRLWYARYTTRKIVGWDSYKRRFCEWTQLGTSWRRGVDLTPANSVFTPLVTRDGRFALVYTAADGVAALSLAGAANGNPIATVGVTAAALADTGELGAVGTETGTLSLFRLPAGEAVPAPASGTDAGVMALEFSPDGRQLAAAYQDRNVRIFKLSEHRVEKTIGVPFGDCTFLGFDPAGKTLAMGGESGLQLWDIDKGVRIGNFMLHPGAFAVRFSEDGSRVVTASSDGNIRVWSRKSGALAGLVRVPGGVSAIDVSPDGQHVLVSSESGAMIWDFPKGTAEGAELLPKLVSALLGRKLDEEVYLERPDKDLAALRALVADAPMPGGSTRSIVKWFLEDRRTRPASPL
jgi:WD40 repeat protein